MAIIRTLEIKNNNSTLIAVVVSGILAVTAKYQTMMEDQEVSIWLTKDNMDELIDYLESIRNEVK